MAEIRFVHQDKIIGSLRDNYADNMLCGDIIDMSQNNMEQFIIYNNRGFLKEQFGIMLRKIKEFHNGKWYVGQRLWESPDGANINLVIIMYIKYAKLT